jgi:hypothetical protein
MPRWHRRAARCSGWSPRQAVGSPGQLLPLPRYQVGSCVTVLYEPAFPQRALILNSTRWLFPLLGGVVGLWFLGRGVWPSRRDEASLA